MTGLFDENDPFSARRFAKLLLETPSLLITDDDRAFRETLDEVFRPRGFDTLLAADGEEALRIVRTRPVHLVLLDMHMPRLTGLETLRMVKQHRALLPCILISADLDEQIRRQARDAHVFSILSKPVSFQEVTGVVHEAMRLTYNWSASNQ